MEGKSTHVIIYKRVGTYTRVYVDSCLPLEKNQHNYACNSNIDYLKEMKESSWYASLTSKSLWMLNSLAPSFPLKLGETLWATAFILIRWRKKTGREEPPKKPKPPTPSLVSLHQCLQKSPLESRGCPGLPPPLRLPAGSSLLCFPFLFCMWGTTEVDLPCRWLTSWYIFDLSFANDELCS